MNMDNTTQRLSYGLRDTPNVKAAWGARLIFPADLVWDRTDMIGEQADKNAILAWLNDKAPKIGSDEWATIVTGRTMASDEHVFTVFSDETGIMKASAQGSYGYLYVSAWLHEHVIEDDDVIESVYTVTIRNKGDERAMDRTDVEDALRVALQQAEVEGDIEVEAH